MKYSNKTVMRNKFSISLLVLCIFSYPLYGHNGISAGISPATRQDTTSAVRPAEASRDSLWRVWEKEFDFIVEQIEHKYVSGRRGMSDEEWGRRLAEARAEFGKLKGTNIPRWWGWRYAARLIEDGHFEFPDNGSFSRFELFDENEPILPLWVQIWKDGSVYNVYDYTGTIPERSELVSIMTFRDGRCADTLSARELGRRSQSLIAGEPAYALADGNSYHQPDPRDWAAFSNYLSVLSVSPWKVVYKAPGKETADTALLQGMTRKALYKLFRKTGNKHRSKEERGFPRKPIVYTNLSDGTGLLAINSFWGKRWMHMLLFGKDWRYKRLLRQAMRRIARDGIENLVIDVSLNTGGMTENVYYTLSYLTGKPIDIAYVYRIDDDCREHARTVLENSRYLKEEDRTYLSGYIDTVAAGTRFRTDTIRRMQYVPHRPKHRYEGNVYILSSHQTYSAAQMFVRYCQLLGIGKVAGQHCGGYNAVTSGNTVNVRLPSSTWMDFRIPYHEEVVSSDDEPYVYPEVDIPIEHPFEEWLRRENRSLDRLLEIIRENEK